MLFIVCSLMDSANAGRDMEVETVVHVKMTTGVILLLISVLVSAHNLK